MNPTQTEALMSTAEVAALAEVHVKTVHQWVLDKKLNAAYRAAGIRGFYVFHKADVQKFLEERQRALAEG